MQYQVSSSYQTYLLYTSWFHGELQAYNSYSATHNISKPMLSVALSYSPQLFFAANPYSLALQKVVKVSAKEEGLQHSENFMGCTVCIIHEILFG